jgi:hypothetical protein
LKVSIIEKIKVEGKWTNKAVQMPKRKPNRKGFYLQDCRDGKFLLVWREGAQKKYSDSIPTLPEAIRAKEQKELYLASLAKGLKVEDPTEGNTRLTIPLQSTSSLRISLGVVIPFPCTRRTSDSFSGGTLKRQRRRKPSSIKSTVPTSWDSNTFWKPTLTCKTMNTPLRGSAFG